MAEKTKPLVSKQEVVIVELVLLVLLAFLPPITEDVRKRKYPFDGLLLVCSVFLSSFVCVSCSAIFIVAMVVLSGLGLPSKS